MNVSGEAATTASVLRRSFLVMYGAQATFAALTAILVLLLGGGPGTPSVLGPVLAVLGFVQCLVGAFLADFVSRRGDRGSALAATLLAGVLLATPAWFLMLALVTGQAFLPSALLLAALAGGYSLGFSLTGRFAARAHAAEGSPASAAQGDDGEEAGRK